MSKSSTTTTAGMKIIAYKGFDKDWECKGFQYEVGKNYKHKGEVSLCNSGFHVCEAPMDILDYYGLDGKIAEVELGGVTDEKEANSKRVGSSIFIKAEMTMAELISAQVEWCQKNAGGKAASSGTGSTAASSGDDSKAASSGYYAKAASSGDYAKAASSGDYSKAASSGTSSTAASSGTGSTAASSGTGSTAASSGDYSTAASSGTGSTAASSGDYSTAASSGDYSTAASSGTGSTAACDQYGYACVAGLGGRVKGDQGSALSAGYVDQQERRRIAVAYVGENGIRPNVWYEVNIDGKFNEVK